MKKKTLMVLGPVSPQPSEAESILKSLAFLNGAYKIHFVDSLQMMMPLKNEDYYLWWKNYIRDRMDHYDGFLGFSFGGVILQQCFSLFELTNKPIILFSTPSFSGGSLTLKLGQVIALCQKNELNQALTYLYQQVFLSGQFVPPTLTNLKRQDAVKRLVFGLDRVLNSDSSLILKQCCVDHLHLIGTLSQLVNQDNVLPPKTGRLQVVPESGMRVLQDNPEFCQHEIWERLSSAR